MSGDLIERLRDTAHAAHVHMVQLACLCSHEADTADEVPSAFRELPEELAVAFNDTFGAMRDHGKSAGEALFQAYRSLRKLEAAATLVTEWLDRMNERDGTAMGGPQWFELGRAVGDARTTLSRTEGQG